MTIHEVFEDLKGKWVVVIETRRLAKAEDVANLIEVDSSVGGQIEYTLRDDTIYRQDLGGCIVLPADPWGFVFDTHLAAEASLGTIGKRYATLTGGGCRCRASEE